MADETQKERLALHDLKPPSAEAVEKACAVFRGVGLTAY